MQARLTVAIVIVALAGTAPAAVYDDFNGESGVWTYPSGTSPNGKWTYNYGDCFSWQSLEERDGSLTFHGFRSPGQSIASTRTWPMPGTPGESLIFEFAVTNREGESFRVTNIRIVGDYTTFRVGGRWENEVWNLEDDWRWVTSVGLPADQAWDVIRITFARTEDSLTWTTDFLEGGILVASYPRSTYLNAGWTSMWRNTILGICLNTDSANACFDYVKVETMQVAVQGRIVPLNYCGDVDRLAANIEFQPATGDNFTRRVFLRSDGAFTLDNITKGTYAIAVKVGGFLEAVRNNVSITSDPADLGDIELKGGDSNGNNAVGFEDFSLLQNSYGRHGGAAAAVTPRTTGHDVDGQLAAGEWVTLYSDPVPDKPSNGCVELARWGAEVRDGILYGAFELDPAGPAVAEYDNFAAGNRLWLGLWIDADPAADPVTGVADGDDQFAPPRVQDINIELGMDNGSLVCRTADWNSLNFWGRGNTFNGYVPVTVNAAYQGHVVEFAVPVADIMAELARTDGAVPGKVWKIGARAAGHVSGEDYAGDITDLQSVTVFGIEGAIVLQGYQGDNATVSIQCVLTPTGGGQVETRMALLNADGTFRLDPVPVGTYNVSLKSSTSLSAVLNNVDVGTCLTDLGTIELANADVNGDDQVSFEDFSILQNNYGDRGSMASPLAALAGGCGGLGFMLLSFLGLAIFALGLRNE